MNIIKKYLRKNLVKHAGIDWYWDDPDEEMERLLELYKENSSKAFSEVKDTFDENVIFNNINEYIDFYDSSIHDLEDEGWSRDEVIEEIKERASNGKYFAAPAGSPHSALPVNQVLVFKTFEDLLYALCDDSSEYWHIEHIFKHKREAIKASFLLLIQNKMCFLFF